MRDTTGSDIKDERSGIEGDGYTYTRIAHHADHVIRARVRRDPRVEVSYALAQVLSTHNTWTDLLEEPVRLWHDETPLKTSAPHQILGQLADSLVERATIVLLPTRQGELG